MDKVKITRELVEPLGDVIGLFIGLYDREDDPDLPKKTLLTHIRILLTEVQRATKSEAEYLSANAELSYQTMLRVKYEGFLRSVIRCKGSLEDEEDFEWFKQRHAEITKSLEDAKCKTQ